jgi:hypothetical protein
MDRLFELERVVLRAISRQVPECAGALDLDQLQVRVLSRENTGAGFFTTIAVASAPTAGLKSPVGDVGANVEGLKNGMGFLLGLDNGLPHKLEGYSYAESTSGLDFERVAFSDVGPRG